MVSIKLCKPDVSRKTKAFFNEMQMLGALAKVAGRTASARFDLTIGGIVLICNGELLLAVREMTIKGKDSVNSDAVWLKRDYTATSCALASYRLRSPGRNWWNSGDRSRGVFGVAF